MLQLIAAVVDRFIKWARPLVLLPPRCHVTWRSEAGEDYPRVIFDMHACRLVAGHEGRCSCFCGADRDLFDVRIASTRIPDLPWLPHTDDRD